MSKVRFADQLSVNSFGNVSPEAIISASGGVGNITFTKENGDQLILPLSTTQSSADSLVTASVSNNTITFTKGDLSTFSVTVDTGSGGGGGSTDTGSLLTTGSVSGNTLTFTKGDGSTFVLVVDTGSGNVPSGTLSSSAQIASEISGAFGAPSASFSVRITSNETAISSLNNATASFVLNSQTKLYVCSLLLLLFKTQFQVHLL